MKCQFADMKSETKKKKKNQSCLYDYKRCLDPKFNEIISKDRDFKFNIAPAKSR